MLENKPVQHPVTGKMFEPYRPWNTLITSGLNSQEMDILNNICKSIKARIYQAEKWQDILAIPCFAAIINPSKLTKYMIETIFTLCLEQDDDMIILLTEDPCIKVPPEAKNKITVDKNTFLDIQELKLKLLKHKTTVAHICNTNRLYDKKIFRILSILKKLKTEKYLLTADLASEFNVSMKTICRDIDLLRNIGEGIDYNHKKKAYYLNKSILWD